MRWRLAVSCVLLSGLAGCGIVAGVYGGLTVSRRILVVQALPALLALGFVQLAW